MSDIQLRMSAFHGKPETIDYVDQYGIPTIEVEPVGADPFWKKVANVVGAFILVPAILFIALQLMGSPAAENDWIAAGWSLVTVVCGVQALKKPISTVRRHVKFTPDAFLIKRREFPVGHYWEVFDLNQPVRFTMMAHDEAQAEREHNDFLKSNASARGRAVKPGTLYQNSYHVCVEHFGQRHDIITVYGRKDATAILTRLKACLEINKARAGKSGSTATEPGQQWKPTPGNLPALPAPGRVFNLR